MKRKKRNGLPFIVQVVVEVLETHLGIVPVSFEVMETNRSVDLQAL